MNKTTTKMVMIHRKFVKTTPPLADEYIPFLSGWFDRRHYAHDDQV